MKTTGQINHPSFSSNGNATRGELQKLANSLKLDVQVGGGSHSDFVIDFGDGPETFANFEDAVDAIRVNAR